MDRILLSARPYLIGAGIAALLGGGGWALAASTSGVVHACASKKSGALRLAGHCTEKERAVTWNVQGPQGNQGKQGTRGATGPSDIYAAGAAAGTLGSTARITSITVPPGRYLIGAKINMEGSTTSQTVDCFLAPSLAAGPGSWDGAITTLPVNTAQATMSLAGADTFSSQQTIVMGCSSTPTGASYANARLWATKTGSLHAKLPLPSSG